MPTYSHVCAHCRAPFTASRPQARYCTSSHRNMACRGRQAAELHRLRSEVASLRHAA